MLIDEAEGFLLDRRKALHRWEVAEVNECLTQMESYTGVLMMTTKRVEGIDQAALRRFDLTVYCDYLTEAQGWALLQRCCDVLQLPCETALRSVLGQLTQLTAGDFAQVMRQQGLQPAASSTGLVQALTKVCGMKEGSKLRIGFV